MKFQVGHGDMCMVWDPKPVNGLQEVTAVAAGLYHSVAVVGGSYMNAAL